MKETQQVAMKHDMWEPNILLCDTKHGTFLAPKLFRNGKVI